MFTKFGLSLAEVDYVSILQQKHTQNMPKTLKLLPKKMQLKPEIVYYIFHKISPYL